MMIADAVLLQVERQAVHAARERHHFARHHVGQPVDVGDPVAHVQDRAHFADIQLALILLDLLLDDRGDFVSIEFHRGPLRGRYSGIKNRCSESRINWVVRLTVSAAHLVESVVQAAVEDRVAHTHLQSAEQLGIDAALQIHRLAQRGHQSLLRSACAGGRSTAWPS